LAPCCQTPSVYFQTIHFPNACWGSI